MEIYRQDNSLVLDIEVDDSSYRHRAIKGEDRIILKYSLTEHKEIPIGAYCDFQGQRYTLIMPVVAKKIHTTRIDYTATFEAAQSSARIWKFKNTVDKRLKFSLTARPHEHLQMFIDNMNAHDSGWSVGECINGDEKLINYNHDYCIDALKRIASEFDTEFEIVGKRVSLKKVEYFKNSPLTLSYGRGNGFRSGVGRSNSNDRPPVEILYVQGGTENIDKSKYGSSELRLPDAYYLHFDGVRFEGEAGFIASNARTYGAFGTYIKRVGKENLSYAEDSLDCSAIYPKRVSSVTDVITVNSDKHFYDFIDSSIPTNLDYTKRLIAGETMTVIFQTGMLAGREFEVKYNHKSYTVINGQNPNVLGSGIANIKAGRRFEIVPQEIDGITMPNEQYKPKIGDQYAVFHCHLPQGYICDNSIQSGASWDMFRAAVRYFFDNEEQRYSFTGELDGIWAKKDWINIGGKIRLGGYVRFTDQNFQTEGVLVRIVGIKDFINNPHSPILELSNQTVGESVSSTIQTLKSEEVGVEEKHEQAIAYTKRRYRSAIETIELIENALNDRFTNAINPVAVRTMSLLVGDESLQFRFVDLHYNPIADGIVYNNDTKQLTAPKSIIQHLTLGIKDIRPNKSASSYPTWYNIVAYNSARLEEQNKSYYFYIKALIGNGNGSFLLSETPKKMREDSDCYYFLVGVLNSEQDGEREFVRLYGFTEILPGRITTERVVSSNGDSYFDMVGNKMKLGNAFSFNANNDNKLVLNGAFVQNGGGVQSLIGCFRGEYKNYEDYYYGDEVLYTYNGATATYRHYSQQTTRAYPPTDTNYWQIVAKGKDGSNGRNGKDGNSPVMVYRGVYNSSATYYGTKDRRDCVKYGDVWYIAKITAGWFSNYTPSGSSSKWESFGASFDSVATNLLLADKASIGDWFISGGKIVSTLNENASSQITLDAKNGLIEILSKYNSGPQSFTNIGSRIKLSSYDGSVYVSGVSESNTASFMTPNGIFANKAGINCLPLSTGGTQRAAMCALGNAKYVNYNALQGYNTDTFVAGVYGRASNTGTAEAYGGYFEQLKASGLVLNLRYADDPDVFLTEEDTFVVGRRSNSVYTVWLPPYARIGQTIFFHTWGSETMYIKPQGDYKIYDDTTENYDYDFKCGYGGMVTFARARVNGILAQAWLVCRWQH